MFVAAPQSPALHARPRPPLSHTQRDEHRAGLIGTQPSCRFIGQDCPPLIKLRPNRLRTGSSIPPPFPVTQQREVGSAESSESFPRPPRPEVKRKPEAAPESSSDGRLARPRAYPFLSCFFWRECPRGLGRTNFPGRATLKKSFPEKTFNFCGDARAPRPGDAHEMPVR
uniref:Uncharacterized protein LOC110209341 isoform X2 n=1 Tax=Phascolarctos cinereus TaxID=38626 RepID=A0A6P5KEI1_PHACI|nr:uncharacterized protein LOC110209341 isoform X2 [Phascolarctos cinereus]